MQETKLNMLVGGFYGDEGKGKIIGSLSILDDYDYVVKAGGGPQAGHTVTDGMVVTQIPSGFVNPKAKLFIARGTVIDPEIVLREIKQYDVSHRIKIDFGCTVIEPKHIEEEKELKIRIGSVGTGTGPARADRVLRRSKLAKDIESLKPYCADVTKEINDGIVAGKKILIEGVQGFGLSLFDYKYYPCVTSQDTTSSQFASDTGIGPKAINEIIIVYKAYMSRVGKGDFATEWTAKQEEEFGIEEKGSVSGRKRRLGFFDKEMAKESLIRNTATLVAITCIDRLFEGNTGIKNFEKLTSPAQQFILELNKFFKESSPYFKQIAFISTGPNINDIIDVRNITL